MLLSGLLTHTHPHTHTHTHTHSLFVPSMQSGGKASCSHRAREACSSEGQTLTGQTFLISLHPIPSFPPCFVPSNLATSTENRERGDLWIHPPPPHSSPRPPFVGGEGEARRGCRWCGAGLQSKLWWQVSLSLMGGPVTSVLLTYNPHFGAFHKSQTDEWQKRWDEDYFARFLYAGVCVCVSQTQAWARANGRACVPMMQSVWTPPSPHRANLDTGLHVLESTHICTHTHTHTLPGVWHYTHAGCQASLVSSRGSCSVSGQGHCKQSR